MPKEDSPKTKLLYILGNSHSGSTVLGFYIGCDERVFYAGELKKFYDLPGRVCSCGEELRDCPMWSEFADLSHGNFGTNVPAMSKLSAIVSLLLGRSAYRNSAFHQAETGLLHAIGAKALSRKGDTRFLLDSSKSIWRLMYLESLEDVDLRVIHLRRDIKGNMASFLKRGHGFFRSLAAMLANDFLIRLYKRRSNTPVIETTYKAFTDDARQPIKEISEFIGLSHDATEQLDPSAHDQHVPTGNNFTREQFHQTSHVLRRTDEWDALMRPWQLRLLERLSGPG